ncbi:MAG: family 16 glycosylhydrolase [Bacteroidia bacterium]|nr:family 16 glycosylhydrolase [Bacteroidia bacterium]
MKAIFQYLQAGILSFVLLLTACDLRENHKIVLANNNNVNSFHIKVEAENFTNSSCNLNINSDNKYNTYIDTNSKGWIALDVNIPVAGRYKSEINVAQKSNKEMVNLWIEDYYDNKDDRTYNITGNIVVENSNGDFVTLGKDGSPLNSGLHRIKIHFDKGMKIDWIKFTLQNEHTKTPLTLMQKTKGKKWKVVWSDEFEGNEIDTNKWTYDFGDWGWGNGEEQYYTINNKENARLEDGKLIIVAKKDSKTGQWTSARLTTRGKVRFLYGKIEFRAKVPNYKGNWAGGWTLGDSYIDEISWPYCGEIDILESVGYEMDDTTGNGIAHASTHSASGYFKLGNQPTNRIEVPNMNNKFHTYSVEWSPEKIVAFVDDKAYFSYNDKSSELSWPFNSPQNIILNLAIGDNLGGYYGIDDTIHSQKMIIDYVRVYESQ